jgi:NAD(P)-dependent dehydrogenase (short-subunit alcohol dehydrogenase family)
MLLGEAVAYITGGAQGFGRAFAEAILAQKGFVLITDIDEKGLIKTVQELQAQFGKERVAYMVQNVTEDDSFRKAFEYGTQALKKRINLLVNNAGIAGKSDFFEENIPQNWKEVVEIDLMAVIAGTQIAIDYMKKNGPDKENVIINVASMAGLVPLPFSPPYAAAKAGVIGLTRSLFLLKSTHNIRAVALAPSFADTNLVRSAPPELANYTLMFGGLLKVEEVVNAFIKALQDEENSGQVLRVTLNNHKYHQFTSRKSTSTHRAKL